MIAKVPIINPSIIMRRLIHVKREARRLHANVLNSQSGSLNESGSDHVSNLARVAGHSLPHPQNETNILELSRIRENIESLYS